MPSIVLVAVLLPIHADVMSVPGANQSRQVPQFEPCPNSQIERASVSSVAPTVIASGARAGEKPQASALSLPAATTTVMFWTVYRFATALSIEVLPPPPRLMLTTAGGT